MTFSRRITQVVCLTAFFAATGHNMSAADKDKKEPAPKEAANTQWNVRVEVLMVAMPEEKFLTLLPDLQNEAKIEKIVPELLEAVKRKEMILRGDPMILASNGQRVVSETIKEKRYPTDFTPPQESQTGTSATDKPPAAEVNQPWPSAFETRNTGVTLEVEAVVRNDGDWIDLNIVPQDVELLGFDSYSAAAKKNGGPLKDEDPKFNVDQPLFFTMKTTTSLSLRNGQYVLLDNHKMARPEGYVEIFIVHAVAKPVK